MEARRDDTLLSDMSSYKDYRLSRDTTPEAEELVFELLRKKSPADRLQMVSQMNATVRTLVMSGLRERHPEETDLELKVRLVALLYGADVAGQIGEGLKHSRRDD